jgi:hypothetical protein
MTRKPKRKAISSSGDQAAQRSIQEKLRLLDAVALLVARMTRGEERPSPNAGDEASRSRARLEVVLQEQSGYRLSPNVVWALREALSAAGYDMPAIFAKDQADRMKKERETS